MTRESWEDEEDERASLQRVTTRARAPGLRAAPGSLLSLLRFFLFYNCFRVVFSLFKSLFVQLAHPFWFLVYFLVFFVMRPLSSLRVYHMGMAVVGSRGHAVSNFSSGSKLNMVMECALSEGCLFFWIDVCRCGCR